MASHLRTRLPVCLLAAGLLTLGACGASHYGLAPPPAELIEANTRLGWSAAPAATLDAALALQNPDVAAAAAERAVKHARVRATVARLRGDADARAQADRALEAAIDRAVAVAARLGRPHLVVAAIHTPPPAGHRHEAAYLHAAQRSRWGLDTDEQLEVVRRLARPSKLRARLLPTYRDIPDALLEHVGPHDAATVAARLQRVITGDDTPAVGRLTRALLAADPLWLPARILKLAGAPAPAAHALDLNVLVATHKASARAAKLERAAASGASATPAQHLGLAWQYLASGASAHAAELAAALPDGASPEAEAIAAQLAALAALDLNDLPAYQRWLERAGDPRSPFLESFVDHLDAGAHTPAVMALKEQQRRAASGETPPPWFALERLSDPATPAGVRAHLLRWEAETEPDAAPVSRHCAVADLNQTRCAELRNGLGQLLADEGDVAILGELRVVEGFRASWLQQLAYSDAEALEAIAPLIDHLAPTRIGATPAWATAAIRVAIAQRDAARARALLAARGHATTPSFQLWAHSAVDALSATPADADPVAQASWTIQSFVDRSPFTERHPASAELPEYLAETCPGDTASQRLCHGTALLLRGYPAHALPPLLLLLDRAADPSLPGVAAAELLGRLGRAALETGADDVLGAVRARLAADDARARDGASYRRAVSRLLDGHALLLASVAGSPVDEAALAAAFADAALATRGSQMALGGLVWAAAGRDDVADVLAPLGDDLPSLWIVRAVVDGDVSGTLSVPVEGVAVVVTDGATLTKAQGSVRGAVTGLAGSAFLWIEGTFAGSGSSSSAPIRLEGTRRSVLRHVHADGGGQAEIELVGAGANLIIDTYIARGGDGLLVDSSSHHNTLIDVTSVSASNLGLRIAGDDNVIVGAVTANGRFGLAVLGETSDPAASNVVLDVSAISNATINIRFGRSPDTTAMNLLAVNGTLGVQLWNAPTTAQVHNVAATNSWANATTRGTGLIVINTAPATWTGELRVGNNRPDVPWPGDCAIAAVEFACDDAAFGGADANVTTAVDLSTSFAAEVTDDGTNADHVDGVAEAASIADWTHFDTRFRGWAQRHPTATFPSFPVQDACDEGNCQLVDWRLTADDTAAREILSPPSNDAGAGTAAATLVHTWTAATSQACAALPGAAWDTSCTTTIVVNATEQMRDGDGNDNGLCESGETCVFTPNLGAYQGHGALVPVGVGGPLGDVRLVRYTFNGVAP